MARRSAGEGSVYERPSAKPASRYGAAKTVRLEGERKVRVFGYGATRKEAVRERDRKVRELLASSPTARLLTVKGYMERWLEYNRPGWKASTLVTYKKDLRLHILPALGSRRLGDLKPLHIQELLSKLASEGKHATADKCRRCLKTALSQAVRWELIAKNPCDALEPVRKPAAKRGIWRPDEVRRFLEAAQENRYYPLFYLAIFTGLRLGELQGLRWMDVGTAQVRVERQWSPDEGGYTEPKTPESKRVVPIGAAVRRVLAEWRSALEDERLYAGADWREEGLAFPNSLGGVFDPSKVYKVKNRLERQTGVPHIRFHDLRRVFATLQALQGTPPKVIQKLLGHSTVGLALSIYTEVVEGQLEKAVLEEDILA